MDCVLRWFSIVLCCNIFQQLDAATLDAFVVKEITDFGKCRSVDGPKINITNTADYDSIAICWRFLTTAYVHCDGSTAVPIATSGPNKIYFAIYQPISGMSEDGKQAGWLGFNFNETSEGKGTQVPWRSILYNQPLKIYEWQSVCVSFSKKTQKLLMFHNGLKYLDYYVDEKHIIIPKDYLSNTQIATRFRGEFSDLQVYSKPMDESELKAWTRCQYKEKGDVFSWDTKRLSEHDEGIISSIQRRDTKFFCKSETSDQTEVHLFGNPRIDPFSNFEGKVLCKRLNGKATMFPKNRTRAEQLINYLHYFQEKSNLTGGTWAWVDGISSLGEHYGASHWYPQQGRYEMKDPDTGDILTNEDNKEFIRPESHTYQKLVYICAAFSTLKGYLPYRLILQKCKRKIVGRVLCEFETTPVIRIKGLCKQSRIDREFQLIEPNIGEGNIKNYETYNRGEELELIAR